jgi:hypothetical protein
MRTARLLFVTILMLSTSSNQILANDEALTNIAQLRWANRVILVLADQQFKAELIRQLQHAQAEIDERDVLWFVFNAEQLTSNYGGEINKNFARDTQKKYLVNSVKAILIGKDGGVKDSQDAFSLNSMLALIDTMPMRQSEMGRDRD